MGTRTFKVNRLYHQFLVPLCIEESKLPELIERLWEARFIDLIKFDGLEERYVELDKLTDRKCKNELFKIVHSIKES